LYQKLLGICSIMFLKQIFRSEMIENPKLIDFIDTKFRGDFYRGHIFHERQMNSCPIGCRGCAVSAVTNAKGSIQYQDLFSFYQDAAQEQASLKITKVEGYDPVFVTYADNSSLPFAQSVKDSVDYKHQIITPVCTTGSWKAERTKWQLEELGKLSNPYRYYRYPSGRDGVGFVLSVPREIRQFEKANYNFDEHVNKIIEDIELLTINGDIEVLIYFNSHIDNDQEIAEKLLEQCLQRLNSKTLEKTKLVITDFNANTLPESCMRYHNSILVSDKGFTKINPDSLDWELDPNLITQTEIASKLFVASSN